MLDIAAAADPVHTIGREGAEIPTPVAIESDGTERYRRMSVRERSRLRPQLLERMGWRYMSLWTIEVFTDPSSCADRIGSYLGGLENHIAQSASAHHGFLHSDGEQLNPGNEDQRVDQGSAVHADGEAQAVAREEHGVAATKGYAENGKEAPLMDQEPGTEDRAAQDSGEPVNDATEEAADAKATAAKTASNGILPTKAAEDDPGDGATSPATTMSSG